MKFTRRNRRIGAAAVELAIVLPIFFLIVLGIVELGRAFMAQHLLSEASRLGARKAIVSGVSNREIKQAVQEFCNDTLGTNKNKFKVEILVTSSRTSVHHFENIADAKSGDMCSVTVTIPIDEVSFLPPQFLRNAELVRVPKGCWFRNLRCEAGGI